MTKPISIALIATSLSLLASGCSLRYDFESECSAPEDCYRFDNSGTFYTCESNRCVQEADVECRADEDCESGEACEQNRCASTTPLDMGMDQGVDMPDEPDMSDDMGVDMPEDMGPDTSCTLTSDCIERFGQSFICGAGGECIDALDDNGDCQRIHYSRTANPDNVIYIGSLLPLVEPFGTTIGKPIENAIQLAIDEFNNDGGLPGGRRLAWISCDSKGNAMIAQRAASHLAQTVGTPAIIGPLFSEAYISMVSNVSNPAGVFSITPTGTSPSIGNLNAMDQNLSWRNIASDEFQAYAIAKRVRDLGPSKILILYKNDKYGSDLQELVFDDLNSNLGAEIKVIQLPNPIDLEEPTQENIQSDYAGRIAQVVKKGEFEPQLTIIIGTNEGALAVGSYLVVATSSEIALPKFILSHGVIPAMEQLAVQLAAMNLTALLPQIEGVAPDIFDPASEVYQDYRLDYSIAFNNTQPALASTTTYDAVMTIGFSAATVPAGEPITGQKIADGIARLVDKEGTPLVFFESTSFVSDGVAELQSGNNLDLSGVSGPIDYIPEITGVYQPMVNWVYYQDENTMRYSIRQDQKMLFPDAPETTNATWESTADMGSMP
jgi:ABC-type branched-subunit amino acid transport system substrate-binding protein/uncharacterized UPF0146 family protein